MMSLVHYCELFNVDLHKPEHDPEADAINLALLFDKFLEDKELVLQEYKKVLANNKKLPEPVLAVIKKLAEGNSVSPSDFEDAIKAEIE